MLKKYLFIIIFSALALLWSDAFALNANYTYSVDIDAISSGGAVTYLDISANAVSDSNGKLSFSFAGGIIPSRSLYNFLLVSIKDGGTTVRSSIVPAPSAGELINFGVSPMTQAQTEALLSSMSSSGTDNPMLVLFGSLVVRSGAFDAATLTSIATMISNAVMGTDGFNDFLVSKVGASATTAFYSAIVDRFGQYTAQLKTAAEKTASSDAKDYRAKAASLLSSILIESADAAGFNISYIISAMKAASDVVEKYIGEGGAGASLDESVINALDMVMIVNDLNLQSEEIKQKYLNAMSSLGATDNQLSKVESAINTLTVTLTTAFQSMEELFESEESFTSTSSEIDAKLTAVSASIETAFSTFMSDIAASNAEITALRTALNVPGGVPSSAFQFTTPGGSTINWPITTVTTMNWLNTNYPAFTYTRASTTVPAAMTWLAARTDFTAAPFDSMPALLQNVFGVQQDLEILYIQAELGEICASYDIVKAPADRANFLAEEGDDFLNAADTAGKVEWFDSDADEDNDASNDPDVTAGFSWTGYDAGADGSKGPFQHLNDLAPFLTGYELQVINEWVINQETALKGNVTNVSGISAAQLQAVFDALKTPQIN